MNFKTFISTLLIVGASTTAVIAEDTDKGFTLFSGDTQKAANVIEDLASRIKINGYVQGGYDYNTSDDSNTFNFKRAILWAKADITDKWSFLYMHDFKASTLEYYLTFNACKALNIRMGQFKNSLTMENPMSPAKLELVNCYSQPVMYLDGYTDPLLGNQGGRDIGLLVYGEIGKTRLKYELAVMNGQAINKNDGNPEKDFIAKLDYRIINPLRIVVSGQLGHGHAIATNDFNPGIAVGDNYKRHRVTAGAEYTSKCFSLRSEWLKGWTGDTQSQGVYATALKPITKKIDAVASFDWLDKNTKMNARQSNYTVGLQYWFFNKCRIQAQYTRCCPSYSKDYNLFQIQTQVGF